jgi:cbb3-type cytochrome oxidase subunit 3
MDFAKTRRTILICLLLSAVTLIAFWPQTGHDFISYDDSFYLTENPNVQQGLTVGKCRLGLPQGSDRRFAPRGAGAWAALARSGLLPACKK